MKFTGSNISSFFKIRGSRKIELEMSVLFLVCITFMLTFPLLAVGLADDCKPTRCRNGGPLIQFPFRHKDLHPQHCGYPGFDLYCDENRETALVLPVSVQVFVRRIDYVSQMVRFDYPGRCIPQNLRGLNLSASPFNFINPYLDDYILLNCSASPRNENHITISCLGATGYRVYAVRFAAFSGSNSFTSCTRIYGILSVPAYIFDGHGLQLTWSEPACSQCERQGQLCRTRNNTGGNQIECTNRPNTEQGSSNRPLIAGATIGSFLFVSTLAALYYLYTSIRTHKRNLVKIEKFLEDYKALKPTRFSYSDIRRITNKFTEKLGEGGYGIVYKGKLSKEIYVAVKVLNDSKGNGEEFINEVGIIGRTHHVNVVRLVGYCAEGLTRALVYDFLPNDSLENFIFKKNSLGWDKLQDIALGIAKGIEYLHQGCDQQILHFDIKPQNILLDHNFNPKVSDFGLAKLCSKEQSGVSMTAARGTMGYIAPEVLSRTFGKASNKSDVYSFGMLLLEMVGGRKNVDATMNTSQAYFPQWIYNQLNKGEEIFVEIAKGEGSEIVRKLTIVGLWCIQWYPMDRPSMKMVVHMLEGHRDNLSMPPNPFPATDTMANSFAAMTGTTSNQTELAVVSES